MTADEIIEILSPEFTFKVIDELDGAISDKRELTLEFDKKHEITLDKVTKVLKPHYKYTPHIVVIANIVAILVDLHEPHIV